MENYLVVEDDGTLGGDVDFAVVHDSGDAAVGLTLGLIADDGVGAVGNLDAVWTLAGVESNIDITPLLTWHILAVDMECH